MYFCLYYFFHRLLYVFLDVEATESRHFCFVAVETWMQAVALFFIIIVTFLFVVVGVCWAIHTIITGVRIICQCHYIPTVWYHNMSLSRFALPCSAPQRRMHGTATQTQTDTPLHKSAQRVFRQCSPFFAHMLLAASILHFRSCRAWGEAVKRGCGDA